MTPGSEWQPYSAALKALSTDRMALGPGRAPKFVQNGKTVMGIKGTGSRPNMPNPQQLQQDRNMRGIHPSGLQQHHHEVGLYKLLNHS